MFLSTYLAQVKADDRDKLCKALLITPELDAYDNDPVAEAEAFAKTVWSGLEAQGSWAHLQLLKALDICMPGTFDIYSEIIAACSSTAASTPAPIPTLAPGSTPDAAATQQASKGILIILALSCC